MNVLVTGGAGYIGSAVTAVLVRNGYGAVRLDTAADPDASLSSFLSVDVRDRGAVTRAIRAYSIEAVVHLAGLIAVGESVKEPLAYWDDNVRGALVLLQAMVDEGVRHIVFSSTAAVYGNPIEIPIPESHPIAPASPYGRSKRAVEEILRDMSDAGQVRYVALRYFNAAGSLSGVPGERHQPETHLIPNVMRAARDGIPVSLFGTDYPTPDGTAVRDYVHVEDLAEAHVLALQHLERQGMSDAFNLANSRGYSVREVVREVERTLGRTVPVASSDRRPGDPAILIGSSERARSILGWRPRHETLSGIIDSLVQGSGGRS